MKALKGKGRVAALIALVLGIIVAASLALAPARALAEEMGEDASLETLEFVQAEDTVGADAIDSVADADADPASDEAAAELLAEEPALSVEETVLESEIAPILTDAQGTRIVPIGRLYNKKTSEHLYTKNANEYNTLTHVSNGDWVQEGVAWYAPETSNTPVFRLYNKRSGDHHYTTSKNERDVLVAKHGWTSEGIAFYSDDAKRLPLYRVYNGRLKRGQHHYTASAQERNALTTKHGWKDEGIGFYGVTMTDSQGSIFRRLELNTNYSDLDVNCDGIADNFMPQFSQQSRTIQLSHNGFARAMFDGRGAIVHYWKYDKTNAFIIVEVARYYGSYLKVMRCNPDSYPNMAQFNEVLSVDLDERNGVVGVNGKRLTIQVSEYRGGNARQITYELNPSSHTFRRV